jgi:putative membrane protein (TIGR04086 family)
MKAHRRRKPSILENLRANVMFSSIIGIVTTLGSTCLFAMVVSNVDVNLKIVSLMNMLCLALGSFVAGYVSAIRRLQKGIVSGALCGLIISCVLMFFGTVVLQRFGILTRLCKLVTIMVCSIVGGIISANRHVA